MQKVKIHEIWYIFVERKIFVGFNKKQSTNKQVEFRRPDKIWCNY